MSKRHSERRNYRDNIDQKAGRIEHSHRELRERINLEEADAMVDDACHACGEFFCIGDCPQMIGQEPEGQGD